MPDTDQTPTPTPTPADLDAFDFDAFVAGIVRPVEVVPIAQDARLGQALRDAADAITAAEAAAADLQVEGKSTRRSASTEPVEVEQARDHYDALLEQARASGKLVWIVVEAETSDARKQALSDAKAADGSVETYNLSLISLTSRLHTQDPATHPESSGRVLTVEQWTKLKAAIGAGQWDKIIEATAKVAAESVTPDFSRPASPSPSGDASSKS